MLRPAIPDDEAKRLALLKACNIIYTPAEEPFDDVARLAAELCGTEIALITLVDSDYQWFKAPIPVRAHVPGEVPATAEAILVKCLRRPREERFDSMTALAHALRSAVGPAW